jgi:hypothetical protein
MKKKTELVYVVFFTALFTWYAYSIFLYMLGPYRIWASTLPLIFCGLSFFISFLLLRQKQLLGLVLLIFVFFYLHTVRFGYHQFNSTAPEANYTLIVISSNNTERMNIFNFHFTNYEVLDATQVKVPDDWKTTSDFLNRCLNLYFSYVALFSKQYHETEWIVVLEDDAIPLEKNLFKKQINSVVEQYAEKDYICLDVRSNLVQGLTGQILGSTAGSIFKVKSLPFIKEEVLKFKTWKEDRYIDKVLVNLCYRKKLNCVAVPLIQENGLPSLLNNQF